MKLGMRTVKSAVGAGLAIWLAEILSLQFGVTAAVITVLCIEKTKKRSIHVSFSRFIACTIGLLGSGLTFETLGYHPVSLTLFLLLFVPVLVFIRFQDGFVSSVVVILHMYTLGHFTATAFWEELQMISIGIGVAMLMNSVMPNLDEKLLQQKTEVETYIRRILAHFSVYMEKGDQGWDGHEFIMLENALKNGTQLALLDVGNQLWKDNKTYYHYFDMRRKQHDVLIRMLRLLAKLTEDVPQRIEFAAFLQQLSEQVKSENTASHFRKELEALLNRNKGQPLPASREEFETRAILLQLVHELDHYLSIKVTYYSENHMKW